jgi:hypothetical protein
MTALTKALEAWRGLPEAHRVELCRGLDRTAANLDDADSGLYMPDHADDYRAAAALLRAASEPEACRPLTEDDVMDMQRRAVEITRAAEPKVASVKVYAAHDFAVPSASCRRCGADWTDARQCQVPRVFP